ncbi:MAG TPA: hypothetical protein VFI11_05660 [Anaerolineales bacterium]|nr:hypothetical protein [Anaerolineales bacterium]
MNIGMLWFDDDARRGLPERIARAAAYYAQKYGRTPTLCLMHPTTAGEALPARLEGIELRTNRAVLREHLWIGIGETAAVEV